MQSVDVSVTTVWQFGFICRSEPRPMVEWEESRCTRSLKRDSSSLVVVRMTVMSFRVKPVGWRGIPNYYCRRFFGVIPLRMTNVAIAWKGILPPLRSSEWQNTLSFRAYRGISNTLHYCLSNESERSLTKYSFSRRFFKTKPFRMTCVFGEKSYPMVITQQYIQGGKMIKQNGVRRKKRPRSIIL